MAQSVDEKLLNRWVVDDDDKKQIIMLPETSLLAPPSTVYQGDVFRYYKANSDWSRVIEGFLTWLAETPAWKDAEHEGFDAIQQILIFLEGITVIENCDDVNACIETSPTIINIQNDITTIEGDIISNTTNINNNTTNINNITEQIETIEETSSSNVYPPAPDQATEPDAFCGASWQIANYLNDFIQDVITDAQTITFTEFITALLGLGGFKASIVKTLWDFVIASVNPNLSTEVSSKIANVAEAFYCNNLSTDLAISAIDADTDMTEDAQAAYIAAINSLTLGKFSELIYIGSLDTGQDCSGFACLQWVVNWLPVSLNADWTLFEGVQVEQDVIGDWDEPSKSRRFELNYTVPAGANINRVDWGFNFDAKRYKSGTLYESISVLRVNGVEVKRHTSNLSVDSVPISATGLTITGGDVLNFVGFARGNNDSDGTYANFVSCDIYGNGTEPSTA